MKNMVRANWPQMRVYYGACAVNAGWIRLYTHTQTHSRSHTHTHTHTHTDTHAHTHRHTQTHTHTHTHRHTRARAHTHTHTHTHRHTHTDTHAHTHTQNISCVLLFDGNNEHATASQYYDIIALSILFINFPLSDQILPKHAGLWKDVPWLRPIATGFSPRRSTFQRTSGTVSIVSRVLHIPLCIYSFIRHRRCVMSVHNIFKNVVKECLLASTSPSIYRTREFSYNLWMGNSFKIC